MSYFNKYPYYNLTDLNLDYILTKIAEQATELANFVALNAIKYADPIQWDITTQYEANTVVVDPNTGTAYISTQAVPSGVALSNTDYWTVVFDLGEIITDAAKNFTDNYEESTTTTATAAYSAGDWIIWGNTLYRALTNITAGDAFVVDSNIEVITMEEIKNEILSTVDSLYDEISDRVGALSNLTTSDVTSIVNAINSMITERGDLSDLTTSDQTSIVNAINEVDGDVGDLSSLTTNDKSSVVNAINELESLKCFINVKEYGAVGDGVTDDYDAFVSALAAFDSNGGTLYCNGRFLIDSGNITIPANVVITSDQKYHHANATQTEFAECNAILINPSYTIEMSNNSGINNIAILNSAVTYPQIDTTNFAGVGITVAGDGCLITNSAIIGFNTGVYLSGYAALTLDNLTIDCQTGIEITASFDVNYISNIHMWPQVGGWNDTPANVKINTYRSGYGIYIHGNADGTKFSNIFIWNHICGIWLESTADMEFNNIAVDNCTSGLIMKGSSRILVNNFRAITGNVGIESDGSSAQYSNIEITSMVGQGIIFGADTSYTSIGYVNIENAKLSSCGSALYFNDLSGYSSRVNVNNCYILSCTEAYHYATTNIFTNFTNMYYDSNTSFIVGTDGDVVIASASTVSIPESFHFIVISGTTTIDNITRNAIDGDIITLLFDQALTMNDGTNLYVGGTITVAAKEVRQFICWNSKYYLIS